jgi:hypothetical protein
VDKDRNARFAKRSSWPDTPSSSSAKCRPSKMCSRSFADGPSLPSRSPFASAIVDRAGTAFHSFAGLGGGLWIRFGSKGRLSRKINIRTNPSARLPLPDLMHQTFRLSLYNGDVHRLSVMLKQVNS